MISAAFAFTVLAAATANAQSTLTPAMDPRCVKVDKAQWDTFGNRELIRSAAFKSWGIPDNTAYTEVVFGLEPKYGNQQVNQNYFCAEGWNIKFEGSVPLSCNPSNTSLVSLSDNAAGWAIISTTVGTHGTTEITNTDTTAVGNGISTTVGVTIPLDPTGKSNIAMERTFSINTEFTKAKAKMTGLTSDNTATFTRTLVLDKNSTRCTVDMVNEFCTFDVQGKYPIVLTGWIGFRLKDELTLGGVKARRWYYYTDVLPVETRTHWQTITAGIAATSSSTVVSQCNVKPDGSAPPGTPVITGKTSGTPATPGAPAPAAKAKAARRREHARDFVASQTTNQIRAAADPKADPKKTPAAPKKPVDPKKAPAAPKKAPEDTKKAPADMKALPVDLKKVSKHLPIDAKKIVSTLKPKVVEKTNAEKIAKALAALPKDAKVQRVGDNLSVAGSD